MNSNEHIKVEQKDDVSVIVLTEEKILDESVVSEISDEIGEHISTLNKPKVLLDLATVQTMSSQGLSMLLRTHKKLREKGSRLRVCNVSGMISEVFDITNLDKVFDVFTSRDDAITDINKP